MKQGKIKAVRNYKRPRYVAGKLSTVTPNHLQQEFTVDLLDRVWATHITYICT